MAQSTLHPALAAVTERVVARSRLSRATYLQQIAAAATQGVQRNALSCTNLAHGFAAFPANDKLILKEQKKPSVAIVTSYNDMLSAHQPYADYPALIKDAVREGSAPSASSPAACRPCATASRRASRAWSCRCSRATPSPCPPPWRCRTACSTPRCASACATRSCRAC
jgi:hypothetical protein